jgi:hypothetical protein
VQDKNLKTYFKNLGKKNNIYEFKVEWLLVKYFTEQQQWKQLIMYAELT